MTVKYSIVIPTRNRPYTLLHCIASCLAVEHDDFEVIVSDNSSGQTALPIVESFASKRLRYVHPERELAMSRHWDFAVGHTTGDYVTVLGDDDGMLRHALKAADQIIALYPNLNALRWNYVGYVWPDQLNASRPPNTISVPFTSFLESRNSASVVKAVTQFEQYYTSLPMIYNSLVRREVIANIREHQRGILFSSLSPDIYSGFAVAAFSERFINSPIPLSISGVSGSSNGVSCVVTAGQNKVTADFEALNLNSKLRWCEKVPEIVKCLPMVVAESYFRALENLPLHVPGDVNFETIIRAAVQDLLKSLKTDDAADAYVKNALEKLQGWAPKIDVNGIHLEALNVPHTDENASAERLPIGPDSKLQKHMLDAKEFGITNVAKVAELIEKIFGFTRVNPLQFEPLSNNRSGLLALTKRLIPDSAKRSVRKLLK